MKSLWLKCYIKNECAESFSHIFRVFAVSLCPVRQGLSGYAAVQWTELHLTQKMPKGWWRPVRAQLAWLTVAHTCDLRAGGWEYLCHEGLFSQRKAVGLQVLVVIG